jgi:hypothetical protein
MMLAVDFDEDLTDVEGVAVASVFSFQPACIDGAEFDTPEPDRFPGDNDVSLRQDILDVAMAEIESVVEPDSVENDIRRKSVALVSIHWQILSISAG